MVSLLLVTPDSAWRLEHSRCAVRVEQKLVEVEMVGLA